MRLLSLACIASLAIASPALADGWLSDPYDFKNTEFSFGGDHYGSSPHQNHWTYQSHATVVRGNHTIRTVRPDATGHFPGDPHGLNSPAYHGHHGVSAQQYVYRPVEGKYEGKYTGKYERKYEGKYSGKYEPVHYEAVPVQSVTVHNHDHHCLVYTQRRPVHVGQYYTCH